MEQQASNSAATLPARAFDNGLAHGGVGRVFVGLYRLPSTLARMASVDPRLRELVTHYPDGIAQLWVCEPGSLAPIPAEVSKKGAELYKRFESHTKALAYVLEGQGFRVAAARMALSAIRLVSRTQYPSRMFSTVEEGTHWLRQHVPDIDEARVIAMVEELRALLPSS
jgi:hypothetical protein